MDEASEAIKTTVLEMVEDYKDNIFTSPSDQADLLVVEFYFKKSDPRMIADHVVKHVLPYKEKIKKRKLSFFQEKKNEIFKGLPPDKISYFADLVEKPEKKGGMSDENKDIAWLYFDTLVGQAEEYKKNK